MEQPATAKLVVVVSNPSDWTPKVVEITNDLESMQALVGGFIQRVPLYGTELDGFDVFVNEDGIAQRLPLNRVLGGHTIFGPLVVSRADAQGDQITLTPNEVTRIFHALGAT